jgi:hypothetical protein
MDGWMEVGWIDECRDGWFDGRLDEGWMDGWTMDGRMDKSIDGWRHVGMERWIDRWMDGRMDAIHYTI